VLPSQHTNSLSSIPFAEQNSCPYAHVLDEHLHQEMSLMEELYSINLVPPQSLIYPVLATATRNGYSFLFPDFPEIHFDTPTIEDGISTAGAALRDAVLALQFPPAPSNPASLPLLPGQFILQIAA